MIWLELSTERQFRKKFIVNVEAKVKYYYLPKRLNFYSYI